MIDDCILKAIDQWAPTFAVTWNDCYFAVPLESECHVCTNLSMETLKDDVSETLAYPGTCDKLYDIYVEMYPDKDIQV